MAAPPRHIVLVGRRGWSNSAREPRETVLGCALVRHDDFTLLLDKLSYPGKVVAQLADGCGRSHSVRQVCLPRPETSTVVSTRSIKAQPYAARSKSFKTRRTGRRAL